MAGFITFYASSLAVPARRAMENPEEADYQLPHFSPNEQVPVRVEAVAVVSELSKEFADFYFSALNKPTITEVEEVKKPIHPGDPDGKEEADAFKDFVIDFTKLN